MMSAISGSFHGFYFPAKTINALLPSTQIFPILEFYLGLPTSLFKNNGTPKDPFVLLSQIF